MRMPLYFLITFGTLFAGCMVTSLNPIYTDDDLVNCPDLAGTWKSDDEQETESLQFVPSADSDKAYDMLINTKEGVIKLTTHVTKLDNRTYLDLVAHIDEETEKKCPELAFMRPVHWFYMIELEGDVLRFRGMSAAWAKKRREKHQLWIDHNAEGDSTLLTAETPRVQKFLRRWDNKADAWESWSEFKRVPIPDH